MRIITHILVTAFSLLLVAYLFPGIEVLNIQAALVAALILAVLNTLVKPVITILTLPITILTLGLFIFIINAGLFALAAYWTDGFSVDSFLTAVVGSFAVSVVSTVVLKII